MKRLYRSLVAELEIMNSTASHVSTAVENTAARAIAPSHGGSSCVSTRGSTSLGFSMPGAATRATSPSSTGTNANASSASAFAATPMRTAFALRAP